MGLFDILKPVVKITNDIADALIRNRQQTNMSWEEMYFNKDSILYLYAKELAQRHPNKREAYNELAERCSNGQCLDLTLFVITHYQIIMGGLPKEKIASTADKIEASLLAKGIPHYFVRSSM